MSGSDARYLSAAEAAKALGVTTRALRLYEQKGLVRPQRTAGGWRAYGPEALARLHQVLTLKRMGLSLAGVGEVLQGRLANLADLLALQEEALSARRAETERALQLVRRARARLAAGQTLSVDDLTTLTRETTMTKPIDEDEMKAVFDPLIRRHFDAETLAVVQAKPYDQAAVTRAWDAVIADAKAARAPLGAVLEGGELAAFKLQEAHVDALLAAAPTQSVQLAQGYGPGALLRRAER